MSVTTLNHRAARLEDQVTAVLARVLRRRGWAPRVIAYTGYGTDGWVRVLGRVLLAPPDTDHREFEAGRGWRRFFSAKTAEVTVRVAIGDRAHEVVTDRGGYVDVVLPAELAPGWAVATLTVGGSPAVEAPLRVVGREETVGVISDIDDTVMITALPRPLLAFWNTFVRHETTRRPVPGMAQLYRELAPEALVVYLSTGAWNVAPAIERFLARHGFPRGPLLMTDWGPTAEGWFRSGRAHKRDSLLRLLRELPGLTWVLVGDDGQHDPELYDEAGAAAPERVRAVAIRQLSPAEQVLTHGTPEARSPRPGNRLAPVPVVEACDGHGLRAAMRSRGLLSPP